MIAFLAKSFFGGSSVTTVVMLVMGLGLAGYIGSLKYDSWKDGNEITRLENEVGRLEVELEREKGKVTACLARVDETNKRIDDLHESRLDNRRAFDMLDENLDSLRDLSRLRVDQLRDLEAPETCEAAIDLLRQGLGEAQ